MNNPKKKTGLRRLVAYALVLAMVLTLMPTSAFAAKQNSLFGWLFQSIAQPKAEPAPAPEPEAPAEEEPAPAEPEAPAEEPAAEEPAAEPAAEEPAAEEPAAEEPAAEPAAEEPAEELSPAVAEELKVDDLTVSIDAEPGAFPEGTVVSAEKADLADVQKAVDDAADVDGKVLYAVDITFTCGGEELQPAEGKTVKVSFSAPELKDVEDATVVHIDSETNEAEKVETVEAEDADVAIEAEKFSVYAVIGDGETGDTARLKVVFHDKTGAAIKTEYVKAADTTGDASKYEKILYDPGPGTLDATNREMFYGWTLDASYGTSSTTYTIDELRQMVTAKFADTEHPVKEGDELNVYAAIFKTFSVNYLDEDEISLGADVVMLLPTETTASYEVNKAYTALDDLHNFEGWNVAEGADKISGYTEGKVYPNETEITISGDVVFSAYAPEGSWLVFHSGDGTYIAPVFMPRGVNTVDPNKEMLRTGYHFVKWVTTDGGDVEFQFGSPITTDTDVYAQWAPNDKASYVVLIWKQKTTGDGYDFAESKTFKDQDVGSAINVVTEAGEGDGRYALVDGVAKQYVGFHLDSYDTGKTVSMYNDTVINVYYNRNLVTLEFQVYETYYVYTPTTSDSALNTYYGLIDGQYVELTRHGSLLGWISEVYFTYNGTRYEDTRYLRSQTTSFHTIETMTGLYGSTLEENGKTWPTNRWWYDGYASSMGGGYTGSGTRTTFLDEFILADGSSSETFYGFTGSGSNNIYFYKQNANGVGYTQANHVTSANGTFYISDKYNGFKASAYSTNGTNWTPLGEKGDDGYYASVDNYSNLYIRYDRVTYNILYKDGKYYDGDDNPMDKEPTGSLKEVDGIAYGSDISSYGPGGANEYKPTCKNFAFEGWYVDDQCTTPYTFTTMPEGLTVYAKWRQAEYRVFLHPQANIRNEDNSTSPDPSLNWGSDEQKTTFKIASGGKVDVPFGLRDRYTLTGWFFDAEGKHVFNEDYFILNDDSVTAEYDKTDPDNYTDVRDPWGNGATWNKDLYASYEDQQNGVERDRFWVEHKLDLYAVWRAKLDGDAKGIGVIYDCRGGTPQVTDSTLYVDQAYAVAQGAPSTAPAGTDAETGEEYEQRFLYWVVQRWDTSLQQFVDVEGSVVYPGDDYRIEEAYAHKVVTQEQKIDGDTNQPVFDPDTGEPVMIDVTTYTMQLRAEYGRAESPDSTHIWWFANNGTDAVVKANTLRDDPTTPVETFGINEAVQILPADTFTRDGYKFLGWARIKNTDNPTFADMELTADDVWLAWDGEKYTVDSDNIRGTAKTVSYVAADEVEPYHDLYAVWEKIQGFTVKYYYNLPKYDENNVLINDVHQEQIVSSEFIPLSTLTDGKYDLLSGVTSDYLYAGYQKVVDGSRQYQTDSGRTIQPADEDVYYVKMVRTSDKYLNTFMRLIQKSKAPKPVTNVYLISSIDDKMYTDVGFKIEETGEVFMSYLNKNVAITKTVTIKNNNGSSVVTVSRQNAFVGSSTTINPNGWLVSAEAPKASTAPYFKGRTLKVTPYWTTFDGETVYGPVRELKFDENGAYIKP